MTTRRLNYTGCQRIRRSDIEISVDVTASGPRFACAFDLDSYEFPASATVVVEAQAHWTLMRFDLGTVGSPSSDWLPLSEFITAEGIGFRLKVIGGGDKAGLILGEADSLRPAEPSQMQDARSFLPVQPADLGHVTWRLSFASPEPLLQVNQKIADWRSFLRRPEVRSLVFPEVYRQLLYESLQNPADAESEDAWQKAMLNTVPAGAGPRPSPYDEESCEAWVADATAMFASKHKMFRGIAVWLGGDE